MYPLDCNCCKKETTCKMERVIKNSPKLLILHLKRFDYQDSVQEKKNRKPILNLPEISIEKRAISEEDYNHFNFESNISVKQRYILCGLVEHSGNLDGGNYIAYVMHKNMQALCNNLYLDGILLLQLK